MYIHVSAFEYCVEVNICICLCEKEREKGDNLKDYVDSNLTNLLGTAQI